jgi:hypothetical protein
LPVQCPICGQWVVSVKINAHIDANCPEPTTPATSSLSTLANQQTLETKVNSSTIDHSNNKDTQQRSSASSTTPTESSTPPTRIAPLFAPKPVPAPSPIRDRSQPFLNNTTVRHNDNAGQKRGILDASPSENNMGVSPAKKKRLDAALESMPLAARGMNYNKGSKRKKN